MTLISGGIYRTNSSHLAIGEVNKETGYFSHFSKLLEKGTVIMVIDTFFTKEHFVIKFLLEEQCFFLPFCIDDSNIKTGFRLIS